MHNTLFNILACTCFAMSFKPTRRIFMKNINDTITDEQKQPAFHGPCLVINIQSALYSKYLKPIDLWKVFNKMVAIASGGDDETGELTGMAKKVFDDLMAFARRSDDHYAETSEKRKQAANVRWGNLSINDNANALQMDTNIKTNRQSKINENQNQMLVSKSVAQNETSSFAHDTEISSVDDIKNTADEMGLAIACDDAFATEFYSSIVMNGWIDGKNQEIENHMLYLKRALIKHLDDKTWGITDEYNAKLKAGGGTWPQDIKSQPIDYARQFLGIVDAYLRFCDVSEENKARIKSIWIPRFQKIMECANGTK